MKQMFTVTANLSSCLSEKLGTERYLYDGPKLLYGVLNCSSISTW